MNKEKLSTLQQQVRIGGKGVPRRKKKVVHRSAGTDDKKLHSSLKKLSVNTIPAIEEVNMIKDDGSVMHFNNPKVQASLAANTFAITGHADNKQITEMLPGILNQLGSESLTHLKSLVTNSITSPLSGGGGAGGAGDEEEDDDEVPDLVENFDEASKSEAPTVTTTKSEEKEETKEEPKVEEPKAEIKEEPKAEIKEEPKAEIKEEPKAEVKEEPKAEIKEETKEEPKVETETKEESKEEKKAEE